MERDPKGEVKAAWIHKSELLTPAFERRMSNHQSNTGRFINILIRGQKLVLHTVCSFNRPGPLHKLPKHRKRAHFFNGAEYCRMGRGLCPTESELELKKRNRFADIILNAVLGISVNEGVFLFVSIGYHNFWESHWRLVYDPVL